jgi:hypothetical protein
MHDNQVFQDWILPVDGRDELLQIWNRHDKADATDAIALLESMDGSLFVFYSVDVNVIDEEWKGR